MENQQNSQNQPFIAGYFSDDSGAVLLTTLIILMLLTLIGISGINTATTDLRITRNYRVHKENLMLGDAAINEGATRAINALEENIVGRSWVNNYDGFYLAENIDSQYLKNPSSYNPLWEPVTNEIAVNAVAADAAWGPGNDFNDVMALDSEPDTEYVVIVQIAPGDPEDRVASGVIVARSRKNGGNVVLEAGVTKDD